MAEELREQIGEILRIRMRDPRLAWVSVIRVEPSSDLRYARVYISVLGDERAQEAGLHALHRAVGAVRAELAHRLHTKRVPELSFHADHSIAYSLRVEQILRDLEFTGDAEGPPSLTEDE